MKYFIFGVLFSITNIVYAVPHAFDSWTESGKKCELAFKSAPLINWDGKSELPISFLGVHSIFNDWAKVTLKSNEVAHPTSFDLTSVAAAGLEPGYWVFKIRFVVFENDQPASKFIRKVAVDMSGKIIEAQCGL